MRAALYAAALVAVAAVVPAAELRSVLASAASCLFEATPFLLAGHLLRRCLPRLAGAEALLGCGCGPGPGARSLPAAAATALAFGPWVALARLAAALAIARLVRVPAGGGCATACGASPSWLHDLGRLVGPALAAAAAMQAAGSGGLSGMPPALQAVAGAALGFIGAPCALGTVGMAGALRAGAPFAAAGLLCVAGIADVRCFAGGRERHHAHPAAGAFGYALLAFALGWAALERGAALVHPVVAIALAPCALAAAAHAIRAVRCARLASCVAPAIMLAGLPSGAPAPHYAATETTLASLFPGERLSFTGTLVRGRGSSALVRYAITCCRADAAPVAIRLTRTPPFRDGTWLHAEGVVLRAGDSYALAPALPPRAIPAPADPFVYR